MIDAHKAAENAQGEIRKAEGSGTLRVVTGLIEKASKEGRKVLEWRIWENSEKSLTALDIVKLESLGFGVWPLTKPDKNGKDAQFLVINW